MIKPGYKKFIQVYLLFSRRCQPSISM